MSGDEELIPYDFQGDQQGVHDRAKGDVDHIRSWCPSQHCDGGHSSPAWAQVVITNMVSHIVNVVSIIINMVTSNTKHHQNGIWHHKVSSLIHQHVSGI